MGNSRGTSLGLVVLIVVVGIVGLWEVKMAGAELSNAQCKEERRIGMNECMPVLSGKLPSPSCCERVRVSHTECVCPVVTPKFATLIHVKRAVRLIEGCGRRVPPHFKCGSITTP